MLAPEVRKTYQDAIERDLESIDAHLVYVRPVIHSAVFHCQQAVEKMLKLLLASADVDYPRTHSIERLAEMLPVNHPLKEKFGPYLTWGEYAVTPRYDFEIDLETLSLPALDELKAWRKSLDELYGRVKEFTHA